MDIFGPVAYVSIGGNKYGFDIVDDYCHTRFFEGNQVHTYMHARIKFHAYSDIKVNTETVSRKKKKDY
jgi:hypothetical protein